MVRKQLRWGILGVGQISEILAPAIQSSRWAVPYAVSSRSQKKAKKFAERHGFFKSHGSYQELLDDPKVDVVYNSLPNWLHCEWTIKALKLGKHVLCEKPLANSLSECKKMIKVSKKTDRLLVEAFAYRFHPQTIRIKSIIESGKIGKIRIIRAFLGFPLNLGTSNVRFKDQSGGGVLMDMGCYAINVIRYLVGSEPLRVYGHELLGTKHPVDLTFGGILAFSRELLGIFSCTFLTVRDFQLEIIGSKGSIFVASPWHPDSIHPSFTLQLGTKKQVITSKRGGDIYRLQVDQFSRCIREKVQPNLSLQDSLANMAVIEALQHSSQTGREIKVIKV